MIGSLQIDHKEYRTVCAQDNHALLIRSVEENPRWNETSEEKGSNGAVCEEDIGG